jgi:hypothetical protein
VNDSSLAAKLAASGEVAGDGHGFWLWVDPSTARTIRSNIDASFVSPGKPGIQPGHLEGRETLFERSGPLPGRSPHSGRRGVIASLAFG